MRNQIVNEIHVETDEVRNLKNLAATAIENIGLLKAQRKNAKEMLDAEFQNSQAYVDAKKIVDEKRKSLKVEKEKVLVLQPAIEAERKYKELGEELKETVEALSDYLAEISKQTGQTEIAGVDGKVWQIKRKYTISAGQMRMFQE